MNSLFFHDIDLPINQKYYFGNISSVIFFYFLTFLVLHIQVNWTLRRLIKDAVNIYDRAFEKIVNF